MKKYGLIILLLGLSQLGFSQDRDGRVMERIEAQKVAFFTQHLDLTVEESQNFWPIYNKYQELEKELRKQYKPNAQSKDMTDEKASKMIADFFEMEEKQLDLKKSLFKELNGVIPPQKIMKLHFAEKQFKQRLLKQIKENRNIRRSKD